MQTRKKLKVIQALKRRVLDDFLQVRERASLFGAGLIRTPAYYRECQECLTRWFPQLLDFAKDLPVSNPQKWAETAIREVLQLLLEEDAELERVVRRVSDTELLRASGVEPTTSESTAVRMQRKKITRGQKALEAISELWRAHPKATYKQMIDLADPKVPTPWPDLPKWSDAAVQKQGAVQTLLARARALSKKKAKA